jgi:UDP-GlcNAc3NAcA epimerase
MIKIATIVGARPQFIKAAAISRVLRNKFIDSVNEVLVHTGQHFDSNMSGIFFDELEIPHPKYNLEISGGNHGAMTGRMLEAIEGILIKEKPDWVLIYGDTNSTLAGALAAAKLHIPVAHVEAGLRSFNMRMPEEVNRIIADSISTLLFCPTEAAVKNLANEGITKNVFNVGDVMFDVALHYKDLAMQSGCILEKLNLREKSFILATCHRAENTDDHRRLLEIVNAIAVLAKKMTVVFPVHPRTQKAIIENGLSEILVDVKTIEPVSFLDMVKLEQASSLIITDSGGVQKEAFFYKVPCITIRDETEWVETVEMRWNILVDAEESAIIANVESALSSLNRATLTSPYGNGKTAQAIVEKIIQSSTQLLR